jgi:hypothetical protein
MLSHIAWLLGHVLHLPFGWLNLLSLFLLLNSFLSFALSVRSVDQLSVFLLLELIFVVERISIF